MSDYDLGLFGPDSVTWRLHADPVLWVAGVRALLLQALHPLTIAAVQEHSDFRADTWGRLMRTADYVGTVTYGTRAEAHRAAARIRRIHAHVSGVDDVTGQAYRAEDPALLLYVHCCEIDSFLSTVRRGGQRLSTVDADGYVAEQLRAARLVGLDPQRDGVPTDTGSLADYFTAVRPHLVASHRTRETARFILAPPMPGWVQVATPARPAWTGVAALAFALLPRWARRMYRLPGLPSTDLSATLALRALRASLLVVPARLREGPHLRAARTRLASSPVRRLENFTPA
jgi:uncharacterized protein (DUF2236 family)